MLGFLVYPYFDLFWTKPCRNMSDQKGNEQMIHGASWHHLTHIWDTLHLWFVSDAQGWTWAKPRSSCWWSSACSPKSWKDLQSIIKKKHKKITISMISIYNENIWKCAQSEHLLRLILQGLFGNGLLKLSWHLVKWHRSSTSDSHRFPLLRYNRTLADTETARFYFTLTPSGSFVSTMPIPQGFNDVQRV